MKKPSKAAEPVTFVRLPAIDRQELAGVIAEAWRFNAPKRLLAGPGAPRS